MNSGIANLGNYFYKLAEKSRDVFWIRDASFKHQLYINPAFEFIWGFSCAQLFENGDLWLDAIIAEDRARVVAQIKRSQHEAKEGESFSSRYRITAKDATIKHIQEVCFPLFDANRTLIGFAGIAKDITREQHRLVELEQASHFFRYFAEKIPAVFWARDDTCNQQLYLSPGYEKVWGRKRETLYENPNSWLDTLHPDDRHIASNNRRFETLLERGAQVQYEYRYRIIVPSGDVRWIKDTSFPIHDDNNQFIGFAGIAEDITKEVLYERELLEAKQRAEVANQAKSDFLAMISHELRTPLNAIIGMAQILKTKGLNPELNEYVDIINHSGNSLLSLVSDILDFARLEAGKLTFNNEPFDLPNLLAQVIHSMQYQAREKNLELTLTGCDELPHLLMGDANRVRQVIVNLLSNAIKFTEQGGITVRVSSEMAGDADMKIMVSVKDTGVGIRADKIGNLFQKFSQIDSIYQRKHRGIGLGLAITKELIQNMGGTIQVTSEVGVGSEFTFSLLLGIPQHRHKETVATILTDQPRSRYRCKVLLVEDNVINQKIAKVMLEDFGCEVDIYDNGEDVLRRLADLQQYQIIFMDVGLPDLSGFDIAKRLRQEPGLSEVPIIAITAHILEHDREQARLAGMNHMIAKPISYEEIAAVLERYETVGPRAV